MDNYSDQSGSERLIDGTVPESALSDPNRLRNLEEETRRIQLELSRLGELTDTEEDEVDKNVKRRNKPRVLPKGRQWQDLRMVNCATCGLLLLGESEEKFRTYCLRVRSKFADRFPPPVRARRFGRPLCESCYGRLS